jgi:hypothetical protein
MNSEDLFLKFCKENGMDKCDIKATAWHKGGMIDYTEWLVELVCKMQRGLCTAAFMFHSPDHWINTEDGLKVFHHIETAPCPIKLQNDEWSVATDVK